jgi:hypothetical protein
MENPPKELLSRAPHFGIVLDVHHVNGHLYDVRHDASGRLHEAADLAEDHFRLLVFIAAFDGLAIAGGGSLLFQFSCTHPPCVSSITQAAKFVRMLRAVKTGRHAPILMPPRPRT